MPTQPSKWKYHGGAACCGWPRSNNVNTHPPKTLREAPKAPLFRYQVERESPPAPAAGHVAQSADGQRQKTIVVCLVTSVMAAGSQNDLRVSKFNC